MTSSTAKPKNNFSKIRSTRGRGIGAINDEIHRLGFYSTPLDGEGRNGPNIHVSSEYNGGQSVDVIVKTVKAGKKGIVTASKYLKLSNEDGIQTITGLKDVDRETPIVLVTLGEETGQNTFKVFKLGVLQDLMLKIRTAYLVKNNKKPTVKPNVSIFYNTEDLNVVDNDWSLITDQIS